MNKEWYVLQVMTGKEADIKAKIVKEFQSLHEKLRPMVLVPVRKLSERRQGQISMVTRTLFPGYIFLNLTLDDDAYYKIKQIPYIIRFLGTTRPVPVPSDQMRPILKMCSLGELIDISKIVMGKTIEVISGPLKGFSGNIVNIDKRKQRAKVRFRILDEVKEIDLGIEVINVYPNMDN